MLRYKTVCGTFPKQLMTKTNASALIILVISEFPNILAPIGARKNIEAKRINPIDGIRKKAVLQAISISSSFLRTRAESKPRLLKILKPSIITKAKANKPTQYGRYDGDFCPLPMGDSRIYFSKYRALKPTQNKSLKGSGH